MEFDPVFLSRLQFAFVISFHIVFPAKSADVLGWQIVGEVLATGGNPYATTTLRNWPPFWMQAIYVLNKIAIGTGLPFSTCLFALLLATEMLLITALYLLLSRLQPGRFLGAFLLGTISPNPVLIQLTCQHGNFYVFAALAATLFVLAVITCSRSGEDMDWLIGHSRPRAPDQNCAARVIAIDGTFAGRSLIKVRAIRKRAGLGASYVGNEHCICPGTSCSHRAGSLVSKRFRMVRHRRVSQSRKCV
jgi:hypothetical protein